MLSRVRSHVPDRPLLLLSALAEGADQLAAEVALEQGITLAAVLPMPLDIYRVQMAEESLMMLDKLLALSDVEIAISLGSDTLEQISTSMDARAQCYEALARYLVCHADVLIALWDGRESEKLGGTCRVVQYARFSRAPGAKEIVESQCETVFHVITPRVSNKRPAQDIQTVTLACETHEVPALQRIGSKQSWRVIRANANLNLERFKS